MLKVVILIFSFFCSCIAVATTHPVKQTFIPDKTRYDKKLSSVIFNSPDRNNRQAQLNKLRTNNPQNIPAAVNAVANEVTWLDIAIFYTPEFFSQKGDTLYYDFERAINNANSALKDSGVKLNWVFAEEIVNDTPDVEDALSEIFNGDILRIKEIRQRFGADLVYLFRPWKGDTDLCGVTYIAQGIGVIELGSSNGNVCDSSVFTHEIGHNLGLSHTRTEQSGTPVYDYGYGYICGGIGTIMNRLPGASHTHTFFSSPDISKSGDVCGIAKGQPDAADARSAIYDYRETAKDFMPAMTIRGTVGFMNNEREFINESDGRFQIDLIRTGDLSLPASVEIYSHSSNEYFSQDIERLSTRVNFERYSAYASVDISIIDDLIYEGETDFWLNLRFPENTDLASFEDKAISVIDNDPEPNGVISWQQNSIEVDENQGQVAIRLLRAGNTAGEYNLLYKTTRSADASAVAGEDYKASSGMVMFNDGQTQAEISIELIDDNETENDESFKVALYAGKANTQGDTEIEIIISANDGYANIPGGSASSGDGGSLGWIILLLFVPACRSRAYKIINNKPIA